MAWWFGDESQQRVAPQVWHVRRCTHDAPILTHSSHSRRRGRFTSSTSAMCEQESATAKQRIMGRVAPVPSERSESKAWPELPSGWADTYVTLHMWAQIVGKIALAQAPPLNHCWSSALQLTARGLTTRPLPHGDRTFTIEFDFAGHQAVITTSDGMLRALPLASKTVAAFYAELMDALSEMRLPVRIWTMPVEIPNPVRFTDDTVHRSYDQEQVETFWRILSQCERVLSRARCQFIGKTSPVHFFWGGPDLAVTRFSGRPAPPREGPAFMREAYSHEVISHGFWPGSAPVLEASFYGYAVPEPAGFKEAKVEPSAAYYHRELGEFLLPYEAVRRSPEPDTMVLEFLQSTYAQAAALGGWDRAALERAPAVASR